MSYFVQPCWTCRKYCGGCSWTRKEAQPVEGWVATPTEKSSNDVNVKIPSFAIHYCPEYEWDGTEVALGG